MPTSILMPSLSPTMEEGVLAKWLVKEGDLIKPGTLLCSVETDKTTVDYESMDEGYLRKIIVPGGSQAKVNQLIAILTDEKDENYDEFLKKEIEKSEKVTAGKPAAAAPAAAPAAVAGVPTRGTPTTAAPAAGVPAPLVGAVTPAAPAPSGDGRVKSSPLARKVAAEAGIPLSGIQGSGPSGRIIRKDVEESKSKGGGAEATQSLFGAAAVPQPTQDIPVSMMRKTIGKRLLESTQNTPVFFVTQKIEVDALMKLRSDLHRGPGYKVSVNDIVMKAAAFALRRHPAVNSSFYGDFIRQNGNIDLCVAVSLDGGLITPIVKDADQKSLMAISQEIKSLVAKAKAGKLAPEEYVGGTFTVSNLGMYGVDQFTAIINPPQAAILAVGGIQQEVYLDATGAPKSRDVMKVTISADHRVIDGAQAAQFLSTFKSVMEHPVWLML